VILFSAIGALAAKSLSTKRLYYKLNSVCITLPNMTINPPQPGAPPYSIPAGATAWYRTPACTGSTFPGYTTAD